MDRRYLVCAEAEQEEDLTKARYKGRGAGGWWAWCVGSGMVTEAQAFKLPSVVELRRRRGLRFKEMFCLRCCEVSGHSAGCMISKVGIVRASLG